MKIVTENTDTLEALLNRIKSVPGVQKTRTIVVLSSVKNNYSVSIGDETAETLEVKKNDNRHSKRDKE